MFIAKDLIYSITIPNLLDTLIMACLIYFVLAWLKDRRAFQILATVLGMGLFYALASRMGLVMTSVIFQYLWAAIIIVLAIVFQPEIREMLERASPIRYLSGNHTSVFKPDTIDETVKAVTELARQKIGALIVFQRLDRLSNFMLKGKPLDSLVSSEALIMIFQKGSPLHDGAVLISGDRIRAASCILPLSTEESLSSRFGTRHRAAVGLTERSDALCVVVSEERGEVSIVERKEISNYNKRSSFQTALERGLIYGRPQAQVVTPGLIHMFKSNWGLKLLSVAAAILMWFLVVGPQKSEIGMSIPIQYTNLPAGLEIKGHWMDRVDARVRGSEAGLSHLRPGSVKAIVDLGNVVTGLNYFRISNKNVQVPAGITIAKIRPSDLTLNIVATSRRALRVEPNFIEKLPDNSRITVTPSKVNIIGRKVDIEKIQSVVTAPIHVADLLGKKKVTVSVFTKPDNVKVESIDPMQVTVSLLIKESEH